MFSFVFRKKNNKKFDNFWLGGDGRTIFYVDPEFIKALQNECEYVDLSLEKVLRGVGYELYVMAKRGVSTKGQSIGYPWQDKKQIKRYKRYARFSGRGNTTYSLEKFANEEKYRNRYGKFSRSKLYGRIRSALRYKQKGLHVRVGAITPSAAMFLKAVQGGRRGSKYKFEYAQNQRITPKMRRMFFVMGIPLSGKQNMIQVKRPLIYPLYRKTYPHLQEMIVKRMQHELDRKNERDKLK